MTFLPIVERELRVAARRKATYWLRVGAVGAALLVVGWTMLMTGRWMRPDQMAQAAFSSLSFVLFVYALLFGSGTTADCISSEKREGTLGLLFLTDLKGYDVVFGKLAATSIHGFYGLLATLPVLAIPLLLGGISWQQISLTAALLLNTMFFSVAMAIWSSVRAQNDRKAMGGSFALLMLFTAIFPALGGLYVAHFDLRAADMPRIFCWPSPAYAYEEITTATFRGMRFTEFWSSLAATHLISWAFLVHASLRLPRAWQDRPVTKTAARWRERWQRWSYGDSELRRRYRNWLLDENAFLWLAARDRLKPAFVWACLGLLACLWFWGALEFKTEWFNEGVYIFTAIVLHTLLKVWIASEAGRRFCKDRQSGALELLLSTPLTVPEILRGQMRALRRQFGWPAALVLALDVIFLLGRNHQSNDPVSWYGLFSVGVIMFVVDCYTLAWVGMWSGLKSRQPQKAFSQTVALVMALPWVIWSMWSTLIGIVSSFARFGNLDEKFFLASWLVIGLLVDWVLLVRSRVGLHSEFRLRAVDRYQSAPRRRWWWPFGRKGEAETHLPS